jgi:hypothetical protein
MKEIVWVLDEVVLAIHDEQLATLEDCLESGIAA